MTVAFTPAQHREYRQRLKARGVCIRCHTTDARPGLTTCEACKDAICAYLREAKRRWRATPETCGGCGQDSGEHAYCVKCRATRGRNGKAWSKRMLAAGRCANCGRAMGAPGYFCPICSEDRARKTMMRRAVYGRAH